MDTLVSSKAPTTTLLQGFDLKERIKKLPLSVQVLINLGFAGLLALDLAIPDVLPFVDEILLSWLMYTGISAFGGALKERRQLADGNTPAVDVRTQQGLDLDGIRDVDDDLADATRRELEALDAPFEGP